MKRAVILIGHGSKLNGADDSLRAVLTSLQKKDPETFFQTAFLEISTPFIPDAVKICIEKGSDEIVLLPYFVHAGRHVTEHIPEIVSDLQKKYPRAKLLLCRHLDFDDRIVSAVEDRIAAVRQANRMKGTHAQSG